MWYHRVLDWFYDRKERHSLVRSFNQFARMAYIEGETASLLEARITIGCMEYRHPLSKMMAGGFRIKAISGKKLQRNELINIGEVVLNNDQLVRRLISLGWDTLEVHDEMSSGGLKWELRKFSGIGGYL